jgi:S-adenosylmethionine hydrolase
MKGAILGVNSEATIVDICHQIPIGNITAGGFVLDQASKEFPPGSIHIAVVDPGVGSERKPILAECDGQTFIGPDNGILYRILERSRGVKVYEIANQHLLTRPLSKTFHGRDLFGPMAALRSLEVQSFDFGPELQREPARPPLLNDRIDGIRSQGTIIYMDHYGNAITDISASDADGFRSLFLPSGNTSIKLQEFYAQAEVGEPLALIGSSSFLEIAINQGNAAQIFGIKIGTPVSLQV